MYGNYDYSLKIAELTTSRGYESAPEKIFSEGMVNTATQLNHHGMRVSYLLQFPGVGALEQNCVKRPLTLSLKAGNLAVRYKYYQGRMQLSRTQVLSLVRKVLFLRILDIEQVFPSAGGCDGFIDDQLLYTDKNHLRVAGSRRVAPLTLKAALEWVEHAK